MSEIDVSKCQFYQDEICFNEECMTKYCEGYECFFKQFHRLKEENYELQTKLLQAHDDNDEYLEQIKQLEFENEALKQSEQEGLEIVAELKEHCKQLDETNLILYNEKCDLIAENEELKEEINGLKQNLLEKENCSARYYLVTTHREWNELYRKFNYQREQKEKYKQRLDEIEEYCKEQNLKYDTTACDILQKIGE